MALTFLLASVVAFALSGGSSPSKGTAAPGASNVQANVRSGMPAAESGEVSWQLAAPISREVVLAAPDGSHLLIAGGLSSAGSSENGVYSLDVASGSLSNIGSLPVSTHDASGAVIGANAFVFGGGSAVPSAVLQRFSIAGSPGASSSLPEARADSSAVVVAGTAYLIGGYSGPTFDPEVLSTRDGRHFTSVAALAVPVRYGAVAALGHKIYIFGGQNSAGRFVSAIQMLDLSTKKVTVVGTLPSALAGAVAATLSSAIYVAGGESGTTSTTAQATAQVLAFDPTTDAVKRAGSLREAVAYAGAAVLHGRLWIIGGEPTSSTLSAAVQVVVPNRKFGVAGQAGAGSPFFGYKLLIADRGNNRLLVLNASNTIVWEYPSAATPGPKGGFYFPDDAFFIRGGTGIISNQESNETIVQLSYPAGKVIWSYGHPRQAGYAPGYLNNPDDAYLLKNGNIAVADPKNCRVLLISAAKKVLTQIGTPGSCIHNPPTQLGSPNGDTPLADGNFLISEINGSFIDEYTPNGRLVWTTHVNVGYPSDPQQLGPDRYLLADYSNPGAFVEFNRAGTILYRFGPTSGVGSLDQPSLVEVLPSGVFMTNDDYHDRMVAIDPSTGAVVWQYGVTNHPGTAPGFLSIPDGFDILAANGSTPTHPVTG